MSEHIATRLAGLRREYQAGEEQLRELVHREDALRTTLLRISGAIQVLEELSEPAREDGSPPPPTGGDDAETMTLG